MGLLDAITGGANNQAQGYLASALDELRRVRTPTAEELQLSPLLNYVEAGAINPALAEAAQAGPSAFENINLSSLPMETMRQVLAKQGQFVDAEGMTPTEQAAIARSIDAMNANVNAQRGAVEQSFAARGIPQSLISAALQMGAINQDAQQGYRNALDARAAASANAQNVLQNQGQLAGQMYGLESNQANTVAAAKDALAKFNAANTQQTSLANQGAKNAAETANVGNRQNISNLNTEGAHQVQWQNQVGSKTQAAQMALDKANAMAGVGRSQAEQATAAGQQQAGLTSGLIGAGATLGGAYFGGPAGAMAGKTIADQTTKKYRGGEITNEDKFPATNFKEGGEVPGHAILPGDHPVNDTVHARLSPGEFVVPRSAMSNPSIREFLENNVPTPRPPSAHPSDVASIIKALTMLREGQ